MAFRNECNTFSNKMQLLYFQNFNEENYQTIADLKLKLFKQFLYKFKIGYMHRQQIRS